MEPFRRVLDGMLGPGSHRARPIVDARSRLVRSSAASDDAVGALNAAFLLSLAREDGRQVPNADELLSVPSSAPAHLAAFYKRAARLVEEELARAAREGWLDTAAQPVAARMEALDGAPPADTFWPLFFPEGLGILGREEERVAELRARRTVHLTGLNARPIVDTARELLFTSNVLLTIPSVATDIDRLPYPVELRRELRAAVEEPQLRWYDHPIQIGVEPAANELLYGLRGLDEAALFERRRGNLSRPLRVALSVSVTHDRLRQIAPHYVRNELASAGGFANLEVYVFTELDTARLVDDVLLPASGDGEANSLRTVFGVDGEYGRHYSFLKAIAALWHVLVEPDVRATFKIDLDQVFAQDVLVAETGRSAFEHMATPLWGARGVDSAGEEVELGMIAGALVNERDIGRGLFTPDVDFPAGPSAPDEFVFFSRLPQALSTRAEMMARYDESALDGKRACLERIHVTGGTSGILVDALRRHRPFTPTFFGRAEDQAYILSVLGGRNGASMANPRLAYAHAAGLIMRHDKEAFAAGAIEAARVGKLVGDDVRILYFSAYAELLGRERIKDLVDPFTGCFISRLPQTLVLLRFALRLAHAAERGDERLVRELARMGAPRIAQALELTSADGQLAAQVAAERGGWDAYYDTLDQLEHGLRRGDATARARRDAARRIIAEARVSG